MTDGTCVKPQLPYASMAKTEATEKGFDDAWMIRQGYITEGSSSNTWIIKGKIIMTRHADNLILSGITRDAIFKCAKNLGYEVVTKNISLQENATNFAQIQVKMNKLCHQIEDKLAIDLESCKIEDIRQFISDYDALYEQLDYSFPGFIKNRVKKVYSGKKVLPNTLNCELSFTTGQDLV